MRNTTEEVASLRCGEEPVLCTSTLVHSHERTQVSCAEAEQVECTSLKAGQSGNGIENKQQPYNATDANADWKGLQPATDRTSMSIVAGTAGSHVYWLQVNGAGKIAVHRNVNLPEEGVGDVRVRQDGRTVAVGGWDARLRLFHMRTGKRLAVLRQHRASITSVEFDEKGILACGSRDKTVSLWDLYTGNM